jgi:hemolysin III
MKRRVPDQVRESGSELKAAGAAMGAEIKAAGADLKAASAAAGAEMKAVGAAAGADMKAARAEILAAGAAAGAEIRAAGAEIKAAGAEVAAKVKPKLRGYVHQYAFFVAVALGIALCFFASGTKAKVAAVIYAVSLAGLLGTSALYHRVTWSVPARMRMRRLDHSMIFVMIAGTVTPIALLAVGGTFGIVLLSVVWGVALAGVVMKVTWIGAPKWLSAVIYVVVGCIGVVAVGELAGTVGLVAVGGLALGGALFIAGAAIYALERPNPFPNVFGYHEVFHVLVVVAAAIHFAVIAGWVVPLSA